jgi:site-specific DNA recombinase
MKTVMSGYIRVSTPGQAKDGEGLNTQRELIKKYEKDHDLDIYNIYSDEGLSGSKSGNRPDLQKLLQDAQDGKFQVVVISRLSRFGRNARELLNNIHTLTNAGVTLVSIKEKIDLSNPVGRAMVTMLAAIAELEREIIKEQMTESKTIKWKEHRMFNGKPPYGYFWDKTDNKLKVNPEEKKIYQKIVRLYLDDGLSMKDISVKLKKEGIISKRRPFNSSILCYIFKNTAYYGHYVVNQYEYENNKRLKDKKKDASEHIIFPIDAFISKSIWDRIQEKTAFNKSKGKRITISSQYWLRDMLQCEECGGRIKPRHGTKRKDGTAPAYYCCFWSQTSKNDLIEHNREKCSLPHIPSEVLEKRIWNRIVLHLNLRGEKYFDAHHDLEKHGTLIKDINKRLDNITNKIAKQNSAKKKLFELLEELDSDFDKKEFLSRIHSINSEINELNLSHKNYTDELQKIMEARVQIEILMKFKEKKSHAFTDKIIDDLEKLSAGDKKALAENMFEKILIGKEEKDPDGFKVKFKKYGNLTVIERFISEGKLPSFNLNGSYDIA